MKTLSKNAPLAFIAVVLFALPALSHAEAIRQFNTQIEVRTDSSLEVVETIHYDFENVLRHGIFRDIPETYVTADGRAMRLRLTVQSVTDTAGNPQPYAVSRSGDEMRIKIGDPD